ncbi:MAG: TetR family transcriptional regulator [Deltaproteobacteria bacterium]|nr:TetR family transcriptional regulator [Deltaproteobacteria bacterium]
MQNTDNKNYFRMLGKDQKKQKIIDTAAELFHKKGYRSTSLDHISKELGITKAAIYHYVYSKEEILSIIYIQVLRNIFKNTNKILESDLPPNEKLRLILRNHVKNIIIQPLSMMCVFFSEENQLPEKEFRKIQEEKNKYNHIVEKIIVEGISLSLFRKTDPKLQTFGILGMCNWVYKWYKLDGNFYTPDQIADHFVGLLERGYLKNNKQEMSNVPKSQREREGQGKSKKRIYRRLRAQCTELSKLIDEMEKHD